VFAKIIGTYQFILHKLFLIFIFFSDKSCKWLILNNGKGYNRSLPFLP